jgi:hypothetical protein
MQLQNTLQSITTWLVVVDYQRQLVCEELGCWRPAVAFDAQQLMFVCVDHKRRCVEVGQ